MKVEGRRRKGHRSASVSTDGKFKIRSSKLNTDVQNSGNQEGCGLLDRTNGTMQEIKRSRVEGTSNVPSGKSLGGFVIEFARRRWPVRAEPDLIASLRLRVSLGPGKLHANEP